MTADIELHDQLDDHFEDEAQAELFKLEPNQLTPDEVAAFRTVAEGGSLRYGESPATDRVIGQVRTIRDIAILHGNGDPNTAATWAAVQLKRHDMAVDLAAAETATQTLRTRLGQLAVNASLRAYNASMSALGAGIDKLSSYAERMREDPQRTRRIAGRIALGATVVVGGGAAAVVLHKSGHSLADVLPFQGGGGTAHTAANTITEAVPTAPSVKIDLTASYAPQAPKHDHLGFPFETPKSSTDVSQVTPERPHATLQDWRTHRASGSIDGLVNQEVAKLPHIDLSKLTHEQKNAFNSLLHNKALQLNRMTDADASHLRIGRPVWMPHPAEIEEMLAKAKSVK